MPKKIPFLLLLLFSLAWFACKKVDIQFGQQFIDDGHTQVIKVDSFTADISTIYVDSFITSATGVSLIGGYNDPSFGKIQAASYFEITPPATIVDSFLTTTFDSLALILVPDKSYYGDTSKPVHITVSRVTQPITGYEESLLTLYNTRSFSVNATPIGTADAIMWPSRGDSIKIRLDDNLGKEFLRKIKDPNDIDIRTSDAFLQYFNGLRVSASANSPMVFGSKDSIIVRLYYKQPALYQLSRYVDFTLANKNHHFNNVSVDRSGTVLSNIATVKQINSTALNNMAYTSYAGGVMAKIRLPSIRDIFKLTNFTKIIKANLIVRPVKGSYAGVYRLPPQLRLSTTTLLNQIGNDISFVVNGTSTTQTGSLAIDYLYGDNTNYSYDLTTYVLQVLADPTINNNGLLLLPPNGTLVTNFNRIIVGDKNNLAGKLELQIIYAAVQ